MVGFYNWSVVLTYFGVAISIWGSTRAVAGDYTIAFICLVLSGLCDVFDGQIARRIKRTQDECSFGTQIDSLADMINFVLLPVVISIKLSVPIIILIVYTLAAIIRLGYYNVKGLSNGSFLGLPVTFIAMFFPLVYCISLFFRLEIYIHYWILILSMAVLFIVPLKVKKPKKVILGMIVIFEIVMLLFLLFNLMWGQ